MGSGSLSNSIVEKGLRGATVFKNEGKLSLEYTPSILPHREDELKTLSVTFRPAVESPGKFTPTVIIRGQIGTGKTVLSKRFGMDFEKYAIAKKLNFRYIHVNCREEGSFYNILKNIIIRYFEKGFPHRGFSSYELLNNLVEILDRRNFYTIIVLDELEALIMKEGCEPLFNLTRFYENRPPNTPKRFSLLCIFREPECEEAFRLIDRSTLGTLGFHTVRLEKYTPNQLKNILEYRVKEAFNEGAVLPEALELITDIAGNYGDARFAIELLWLAGKYADTSSSPEVYPEHVRSAQTYAHPSMRVEDLKTIGFHEKLLLLAVARLLRSSGAAYLSMSEVEREYQSVCEEFSEKKRTHTQIWKFMKTLSITGMVSTKPSGKGYRGKTTFIGLYVPSEKLEKTLLKILEAGKTEHKKFT